MGRKQREISPSGVYHICLRGVNKQRIFEYEEDYAGFFRILKQSMWTNTDGEELEEPNFNIHAYCLMDNHVHLLLGTREVSVSDVVKRISSSYARFFNWRYQRVGHLFQDRFRSETCKDAEYFYTLMKYIHQNPLKAGVCQMLEQYRYSSYQELTDAEFTQRCQTPLCKKDGFLCSPAPDVLGVDVDEVRSLLVALNEDSGTSEGDPYALVRDFISSQYYDLKLLADNEEIDYETGEVRVRTRSEALASLADDERSLVRKFTQWCQTLLCNLNQAKQDKMDADALDRLIVDALLGLSGTSSISDFQKLDKKTMRNALAQVRDAGISIKRLSRISGISEGIIRGSKNPKKAEKAEGNND